MMMTIDEIRRGLEMKLVEEQGEGSSRLNGSSNSSSSAFPMIAVPALKTADMHRQRNEMMTNCAKPQTSLKRALSASQCVTIEEEDLNHQDCQMQ